MVAERVDARTAMQAGHDLLIRTAAAGPGHAEQMVAVYYAEDARLLPPNSPAVIGRAQIRDFFEGMAAGGRLELTLQDDIVQESGELAYLVGAYTLTIQPPEGEAARDTGKYLEVWRRQAAGAWQCVADMFSSDLPAS
jgi:ketosteroid isomerase-like protein